MRRSRKLPTWTPFERATALAPEWIKTEAPDLVEALARIEVWKNSRYTVDVRRDRDDDGSEIIHLSIKANDRTAQHDWRDFQRIKNELLGPEQEAVELYPAESRLVDTSNQYHLWCVKDARLPLGYNVRLVSETGGPVGAVQRPFEDDRPADLHRTTLKECVDALRQDLASRGRNNKECSENDNSSEKSRGLEGGSVAPGEDHPLPEQSA